MNNLAKEINELLLNNPTIKEYLSLKKEIENDKELVNIYNKLNSLRKEICHNKELDSNEYYNLLNIYKNDRRVTRYEKLQKEIKDYFAIVSDILSLK